MFSPGLVGIGPFPRPLVPFGASSWPLSWPCRIGNLLGNPVKFIAQCDYLVRIGALTGVRDGQRRLRSLLGPRSPKKMARSRRSRAGQQEVWRWSAPIRLSRPSSAAGNRNSGRRIGTPELVTPHRHSRACDNDCATICDPRHGEMRARAYAPSNQTQGAMRRVRTGMHDGRDLFPG